MFFTVIEMLYSSAACRRVSWLVAALRFCLKYLSTTKFCEVVVRQSSSCDFVDTVAAQAVFLPHHLLFYPR